MMPDPEYERWSALKGEDYDRACEQLGLVGYAGDRREYQARVNRIRALAIDGKVRALGPSGSTTNVRRRSRGRRRLGSGGGE
jgi:hypothetical protein